MGVSVSANEWAELDPWWHSYLETRTSPHLDDFHPSETKLLSHQWSELDAWWDSHLEEREQRRRELRSLLERLNNEWDRSESQFDSDPLAAGSNARRPGSVPLRPNQEENWSHWLAHLIRSSDGRFLSKLLGRTVGVAPRTVRREAYLPDSEGTDRRADIVAEYSDQAVSIEVKKGDEHYRKTRHTAALAERGDLREWTHILLVPERKERAVRRTFRTDITTDDDDRPVIHATESNDILVMYWEDVSRELRRTLLEDGPIDELWDASAYLFVAIVEQSLLDFEHVASSDKEPERSLPTGAHRSALGAADLSEQTAYFEQIVESMTHE